MRRLPKEFIVEANKQVNIPIDLIAIEITSAFTSYCRAGTGGQSVQLDSLTAQALSVWELEQAEVQLDYNFGTDIADCVTNLASGAAWILSCDEGLNAGINRVITAYSGGVVTFSGQAPYPFIDDGIIQIE